MQKFKKHLQENFDTWFHELHHSLTEKEGHTAQEEARRGHGGGAAAVGGGPGQPRRLIRSPRGGRPKPKIVCDLAEVRRVFDFFDKDQSGFIEPHEFLPLLSRLLRKPKSEINMIEVLRSWDAVDTDHRGSVSFEAFRAWYCSNFNASAQRLSLESDHRILEVSWKLDLDVVNVRKLWAEFQRLDLNTNRELEFDEFRNLIREELGHMSPGKGEAVLPMVLDRLWNDADADGDGAISFIEFAEWYIRRVRGQDDHGDPVEGRDLNLGRLATEAG